MTRTYASSFVFIYGQRFKQVSLNRRSPVPASLQLDLCKTFLNVVLQVEKLKTHNFLLICFLSAIKRL